MAMGLLGACSEALDLAMVKMVVDINLMQGSKCISFFCGLAIGVCVHSLNQTGGVNGVQTMQTLGHAWPWLEHLVRLQRCRLIEDECHAFL